MASETSWQLSEFSKYVIVLMLASLNANHKEAKRRAIQANRSAF